MNTLWQDLKFGARMLRKNPAFAAVGILTLALGIGANTAMFTAVNALMLKRLPVWKPEQLMIVGNPAATGSVSTGTPRASLFSYPLFQELRKQNDIFEDVIATTYARGADVNVHDADTPVRMSPRLVTGNYFSFFGVPAAIGRVFNPNADSQRGGAPYAVITDAFWKKNFNADPAAIGRTIRVNGFPLTIVGVTPPSFFGEIVGEPQSIFIPISMQEQVMPGRKYLDSVSTSWLQIMGRTKPGVTEAQAKDRLQTWFDAQIESGVFAKLAPSDKEALARVKVEVHDGSRGLSRVRRDYSKPMLVLLAIVGLVLLIACVNIANLLLARLRTRQREIAVRLSIGAKPARLMRQFLTESLLLAAFGGVIGFLISHYALRLLFRVAFSERALQGVTQMDWRVLAFTFAVCTLATLLFGLAPAVSAVRGDLLPALQEGGRSSSGRRWNLGKLLVAGQVALSILVLFAAGLLLRTLHRLQSFDLGYDRSHLIIVNTDPITAAYKSGEKVVNLGISLAERFRGIPGVDGATVTQNGLFSGSESADAITVPGLNVPARDRVSYEDHVGPGYFSTVGIPIIAGREILPSDTATSHRVAVVNEKFVQFFFHGENPIGRTFSVDDTPGAENIEIVGIAKDVHDHGIQDDVHQRAYFPYAHPINDMDSMVLIVKTRGNPEQMIETLRKVANDQDPALQLTSVRTLDYLVDDSIQGQKSMAQMSGFFGGLALLLASIGLYGVMSYSVAGRTRELGIRIALGAQRSGVLAMVLQETLIIASIGVGIGLPAAVLAARALKSILFDLSIADPVSLLVSTAVLIGVAFAAGYIPARRAATVNPMVALRWE